MSFFHFGWITQLHLLIMKDFILNVFYYTHISKHKKMKVYGVDWPIHDKLKRNLSRISSASHSTGKYVSPPHGAVNTRCIYLRRLLWCVETQEFI